MHVYPQQTSVHARFEDDFRARPRVRGGFDVEVILRYEIRDGQYGRRNV